MNTTLIAGGTSGVGLGIAQHLSNPLNHEVFITGRHKAKGEKALASLTTEHKHFICADLTSVDDCQHIAEHCQEKVSHIDAFIYAAGNCNRGTIETTSESTWDAIFDTNVKGAFFLTQALLPLLRKSPNASIVNICSFSSYCGRPELIAYNASKAALVTFTKSLGNTLKEDRIRVNGINLGWTDTEEERKRHETVGHDEKWFEDIASKQPAGRLILPQDVAHLVDYLISDKACMMTGSIIDFHQHVRV